MLRGCEYPRSLAEGGLPCLGIKILTIPHSGVKLYSGRSPVFEGINPGLKISKTFAG